MKHPRKNEKFHDGRGMLNGAISNQYISIEVKGFMFHFLVCFVLFCFFFLFLPGEPAH